MANSDHLKILRSGNAAIQQWIAANPNAYLDCSTTNLNGHDFRGLHLIRVDFTGSILENTNLEGANLSGAILQGAILTRGNLTKVDLTNANCKNATFNGAKLDDAQVAGADFYEASLVRASLKGASLQQAKLIATRLEHVSLENADLRRCDLTQTKFHNSNLSGACLIDARLDRAGLRGCDLSKATLDGAVLDGADLTSADLSHASLVGTSIRNASLTSANFAEANLDRADLLESDVTNVNFNKARGLTRAKNLVTVRIGGEIRYFDFAIIPAPERLLSWERIRWLGRLPLFGASYSALIAIPFLYYLLDMFNRRVDVVRTWATQELANDGAHATTAHVVLDHLHREPIPSLSLYLLISTILLGIGATIFAMACPARVREFSREQWRDELEHSLIHYSPFAWRYRWLRIACVICYAVGGFGVLVVVASKLWNVLWFIIDNR